MSLSSTVTLVPHSSTVTFISLCSTIQLGLVHGVACHLCHINSSIGVPWFEAFYVPSFEPKTNEFEPGLCLYVPWFVSFSCLVCIIFEPGSWHFRAWFAPFSSLVRSIFEPALCHFRACFLPFWSLLHAIFEHSSCTFCLFKHCKLFRN